MFWNELLQLLHIPLGLRKSGLREVDGVAGHGDTHIVTLCILQETKTCRNECSPVGSDWGWTSVPHRRHTGELSRFTIKNGCFSTEALSAEGNSPVQQLDLVIKSRSTVCVSSSLWFSWMLQWQANKWAPPSHSVWGLRELGSPVKVTIIAQNLQNKSEQKQKKNLNDFWFQRLQTFQHDIGKCQK